MLILLSLRQKIKSMKQIIKTSAGKERGNPQINPPGNPLPNKPTTPAKADENPDPTKPRPGGNEPEKNDPTRIEEPSKTDPTRIDEPPPAGTLIT